MYIKGVHAHEVDAAAVAGIVSASETDAAREDAACQPTGKTKTCIYYIT